MMTDESNPYDDTSTAELINIALMHDNDDAVYWDVNWALRRRATMEVFDAARRLCESACPVEQCLGCDILAQLGAPEHPFASASFPIIAAVVGTSKDPDVVFSGLSALGWLRDDRGVDLVLQFVDHGDANVRYAATHSLIALADDPRCIDALIRLTTDADVEVRDWATCGLGDLRDEDTPAVRQALVARLDDPDDIVRGEALVGLAKRQDERVIAPLLQAFEAGTYNKIPTDYAQDALDRLSDLFKYPQLLTWKNNA